MTTPVLFHFLTPEGVPVANAEFEIQLATSNFDLVIDGVLMPRTLFATTDVDGRATVNLWSQPTAYLVTMLDPASEVGLRYKFYVPEVAVGESVRLQDIVVPQTTTDVPYVDLVYQQIQTARNDTLAYRDAAAISATSTGEDAIATAADRVVTLTQATLSQGYATAAGASAAAASVSETEASLSAQVVTAALAAKIYESWNTVSTNSLSGVVGALNDTAIIINDAATHTDPVTGTIEPNAGIFQYKTSAPAGWKRIGDTDAVIAASYHRIWVTGAGGAAVPLGIYLEDRNTSFVGRQRRFFYEVLGGTASIEVWINGVVVHAAINVTGSGVQAIDLTTPAEARVDFRITAATATSVYCQIDARRAA